MRVTAMNQQHTSEPSERLCLMVEPPSDEINTCPPFSRIILLILLIHSTLSAVLSAFKMTALCAAREDNYD